MESSLSILSITFLKEFIKFNVNMDTMIKNAKRMELLAIYATDTQTLKMIINKFDEKLKERISNTHKFSKHDHADYAHAKRVCKDF